MKAEEFLNKIQYKFSPEDRVTITKAFNLATEAHAGQKRFSGEDYISHPIAAALILAAFFPDSTTIAATLLHDVPEDTATSLETVKKEFGPKIAMLVDGVTKLSGVRLRNSTEKLYVDTLRKMFLATSHDVRVILIKLADRLHNMRTINFVKESKQKRIAQETLEIYAPIANRLGIGEWKDELEDRSFAIVDPKAFLETEGLLEQRIPYSDELIPSLQKDITTILRTEGVKYLEIKGRVKRVYSLYKKLNKYDGDITKIYDLIALRVITKSTGDCYSVLGVIHKHLQPLPGRVKDFIAMPKPNGYRSIHTSVFAADKTVFEIQIRTEQMDDQAERGIAAHWFYTESGKNDNLEAIPKDPREVPELQWMQELQNLQENPNDPKDFLDELRMDFFKDHIFVLTPKGDVKDLPEGATPIDFAFSVHTDLALHMMGAKVNGKMVKMEYELKSGDLVEIIKTKKEAAISQDWLNNAKTANARNRIRKYLNENQTGIFNRLKNMIVKK
jgi:guanosine-3',5'-bis(diphosphate) 3'-pyrophosphohydrolase